MSPIRSSNITFRTVLIYAASAILLGLFLWYLTFQARLLLGGPQIQLTDEPAFVQTEQKITLSGKTDNITSITLNGRPILTDEAGYFSEPIILENGYTVVSLEAHDRYGRSTTLSREYVYTPRSLLPS